MSDGHSPFTGKAFTKFLKHGLSLLISTSIGIGIYTSLTEGRMTAEPLATANMTGFFYAVVLHLLIGFSGKYVTAHHPDYIGQYFTAVSGIRFLSVLAMLAVCYFSVNTEDAATYALLLLLYYIITVAFHTVFFSHIIYKKS